MTIEFIVVDICLYKFIKSAELSHSIEKIKKFEWKNQNYSSFSSGHPVRSQTSEPLAFLWALWKEEWTSTFEIEPQGVEWNDGEADGRSTGDQQIGHHYRFIK